ncbi:DUF2169 family type VI secretion system accessory protein [Marinicellulosiphila megalodicopiae]|uniref:DUF2169 family type VI secretion system accessory protein n=1 Tax=Marinicellulosiphila megalodicopiae TaxID=2724896 RepID=UPI003BAFC943
MIELVNDSRFQVAWIAGKKDHPKDSLTIIIKGTFDLKHQETAMFSEIQMPVIGDQFAFGNPKGWLQYDSDFAFFKDNADFIVNGSCYPPKNETVNECHVKVSLDSIEKKLLIKGDRYESPGLAGSSASKADNFSVMSVNYSNSYGGKDEPTNPAGKGIDKNQQGIKWFPNVIDLNQGEEAPASFGAVNKAWPVRIALAGTYDENWQNTRWPWFPEDFDWAFFNAAQPELIYDGYLKGDEPVKFHNMHPDHPVFEASLPEVMPVCYLNNIEEEEFIAVEEINLDTVTVDMDSRRMMLVWRAVVDVSSASYPEISYLFVSCKTLEEADKDKEVHQERFIFMITPEDDDLEMPEFEPEPEQEEEPEEEKEEPAGDDEAEKAFFAQIDKLKEDMKAAGQDPQVIDDIANSDDPSKILNDYFASLDIDQEQADQIKKEAEEKMTESLKEQDISQEDIDILLGKK